METIKGFKTLMTGLEIVFLLTIINPPRERHSRGFFGTWFFGQ